MRNHPNNVHQMYDVWANFFLCIESVITKWNINFRLFCCFRKDVISPFPTVPIERWGNPDNFNSFPFRVLPQVQCCNTLSLYRGDFGWTTQFPIIRLHRPTTTMGSIDIVQPKMLLLIWMRMHDYRDTLRHCNISHRWWNRAPWVTG